ncbi:MAG: aldo/keto reductase [Bacteriovoracales bacterium]|nr:aldo/keto reductase [Bacteriovoracales bacterium]
MEYRRLGKTGQEVSVIGFGGASLSGEGGGYGFGPMDESKAQNLIHASLERGLNLFDTAPLYGKGLSEKRLGKALTGRREKAFIVSKCGLTWKDSGRIDHDNDPKVCQKMLEQSLRDLRTDFIDLYMIHHPHPKVDIRQTLEVLTLAQEEGKVKYIGVCNVDGEELSKALEVSAIDVIQNECHFFSTEKMERLFPLLQKKDIGALGWGTLHKGVLAGTVREGRLYESSDIRAWAPWFRKSKEIKRQIRFVHDTLFPLLKGRDMSPFSFALHSVLRFSPLSSALCGFRSIEQLNDLLGALDKPVPQDMIERLGRLYRETKSDEA